MQTIIKFKNQICIHYYAINKQSLKKSVILPVLWSPSQSSFIYNYISLIPIVISASFTLFRKWLANLCVACHWIIERPWRRRRRLPYLIICTAPFLLVSFRIGRSVGVIDFTCYFVQPTGFWYTKPVYIIPYWLTLILITLIGLHITREPMAVAQKYVHIVIVSVPPIHLNDFDTLTMINPSGQCAQYNILVVAKFWV